MNSQQASRNRNQARFRDQPIETTGDRLIDQAIARFIHNPATLPCDVPNTWTHYWMAGGTDGVPEPYGQPIPKDERHKGSTPVEPAYTRQEIMEARQ